MPSRIQAELKQTKPFRTLQQEAAVALMRTAAVLDHASNDVLKPFGLTGAQYNVLRILRGAGEAGLCGREVGERMVAPVPDVTRMLDRMEAAGWITRDRDPNDRRHVKVTITDEGLATVEAATPALEELEESYLGALPPAVLRTLLGTLDAIRSG